MKKCFRIWPLVCFFALYLCLFHFSGCGGKDAAPITPASVLKIDSLVFSGEFAQALHMIDSIATGTEITARLHFYRGICLDAIKHDDPDAFNEFSEALRLCPPDSCKLRRDIYEHRGLIYSLSEGNMDSLSLADYLTAHAITMKCPEASYLDSTQTAFNIASHAASLGIFEIADSFARYLKANFPNSADGYEATAILYEAQKEYLLATKELDTVIAIEGRIGSGTMVRGAYSKRADFYHKSGNLPAACADWRKAVELGLDMAQAKLDSFCREQ